MKNYEYHLLMNGPIKFELKQCLLDIFQKIGGLLYKKTQDNFEFSFRDS